MMDVSDGLLIDAQRMAVASNLALEKTCNFAAFLRARSKATAWSPANECLFGAAQGRITAQLHSDVAGRTAL